MLVTNENVRIQKRLKYICTPQGDKEQDGTQFLQIGVTMAIDNIRPMDWKHITCAHII